MKKFLSLFISLFVVIAVSAAEKPAIGIKNVTSAGLTSTFVVTLKNNVVFTGFQVDFETSEGVTITKALATESSKITNDDDEYIYSFAKDLEKGKYISIYAASAADRRVILDGGVIKFTASIANESTVGTITLTPMGADIKGVGYYDMDPLVLTISYGSITGADVVKADKKSTKVTKYLDKNGKLVIEKGDKKYTAQGVETK